VNIDDLLKMDPYSLPQVQRDALLIEAMRPSLIQNRSNPHMAAYYDKLGFEPTQVSVLADIPPVPAAMFKQFDLATVPPDRVYRWLRSSATSGQTPSRVPLDKVTARRQTRALSTILAHFIGKKRIPMLVFDLPQSGTTGADGGLTARGAGIRGFMPFASEVTYVVRSRNGRLELDRDALLAFHDKHANHRIFAFGFTFVVWQAIASAPDLDLSFADARLFHGGGWKRLVEQRVDRAEFSRRVAAFFGHPGTGVHDYYGMVEQTGVIFVDCEHGHKHVPAFADVLVRDVYTMQPVQEQVGLINVLSAIPNSYPGQSILTDDMGKLLGVDDCPCGRRGKYFEFTARVARSEVRGCSNVLPAA